MYHGVGASTLTYLSVPSQQSSCSSVSNPSLVQKRHYPSTENKTSWSTGSLPLHTCRYYAPFSHAMGWQQVSLEIRHCHWLNIWVYTGNGAICAVAMAGERWSECTIESPSAEKYIFSCSNGLLWSRECFVSLATCSEESFSGSRDLYWHKELLECLSSIYPYGFRLSRTQLQWKVEWDYFLLF